MVWVFDLSPHTSCSPVFPPVLLLSLIPPHTCLQLAWLALPCSQCLSSTCTSASCWCSVCLSLCCSPSPLCWLIWLRPCTPVPVPWAFLICSSILFSFDIFLSWPFVAILLFAHLLIIKLTFCFRPADLWMSAFDPHHFAFVAITWQF